MHAKVDNIVIEKGKVKGVKIGEDFISSKTVLEF